MAPGRTPRTHVGRAAEKRYCDRTLNRIARAQLVGVWVLLSVLTLHGPQGRQPEHRTVPRGSPSTVVPSSPSSSPETEERECAARIAAIQVNDVAASQAYSSHARALLLARVKASPVLFVRTPVATVDDEAAEHELGASILQSPQPAVEFRRRLPSLLRNKAALRALLLREGYFYVEDPELAQVAVSYVRLDHLFDGGTLVLQRGAEQHLVRRRDRFFEHVDGPSPGRRAQLLMFDRVWQAHLPAPTPLHLDLSRVHAQLGHDELEVVAVDEPNWKARLRFGDQWAEALLTRSEHEPALLKVDCLARGQTPERVAAARTLTRRRNRVVSQLERAIHEQVDEQLPFDEPRTEEGQQDGRLRSEWSSAYRRGRHVFEFNGDSYFVFDQKGRPLVPQVCIDFITDSLERFAGSWYLPRGISPGRPSGRLDFSRMGVENRRSVESFLAFASERPELFDVHWLPVEERIPYARGREFFQHLYEHRDRYLPGDIVVIYGLRDDDKMHYHSFFVAARDPVSGMPTLVASNAGRPRIRTWAEEMASAPRRSIFARVRPRLSWLEGLAEPAQSHAGAARSQPHDTAASDT